LRIRGGLPRQTRRQSAGDVSAALGRLKDKDFQSLSSAIEALEEGNLTSKPCVSTTSLSVSGNDEVGVMAKNFNKMLESLNGMIASYNTTRDSLSNVLAETMLGSDTIATSSSEVASGNQELASRTSQQAASLEETAASVEEITSLIDHSAENAKSAARLAEETKELAKSGGSVVKSTVASMREIEISSKKIAEIITVIDEIAFQTNLLALNAAVEAARVGEQGKGFAVVASEVRSLAGRSSIAAKEIKALVKDSVAKVSQGTSLVNKSGDELTQIVVAAEKVAKMVLEISNSTQEQSIGISQINKAILKIDNITQQNAALVEETSAASEGMADQARNLQRLVSRFHIDPSYRKNASSSDNTIHIDHSPKIKQVVNSTRKAVKTSEAPKLRISHSETTEEF
jgi:methyl-accepting chemotaxis protein